MMKRLIAVLFSVFLLHVPAAKDITLSRALEYFNEIALKNEYGGEGSEGVVKKWADPITIYVMGYFTEEDYGVIKDHICFLRSIEGMPDIAIVNDINHANVIVDFITQWEISRRVDVDEIIWGYAKCFWNENYKITGADVYVVYDNINEKQRRHVIIEELTQILGLMNDSTLYDDSIFQNRYSETTSLSSLDVLLIKMLYSSGVKPGMRGSDIKGIIGIWYSRRYR